MSDLLGHSLGRYHILERLGEGGMATVYKAYDTRLERDVAVKVLRTEQFPPIALERILKRFEREAKALAKLTHPNIVAVIDYGEQQGAPYLVMPYLPGGTLKQTLKERGRLECANGRSTADRPSAFAGVHPRRALLPARFAGRLAEGINRQPAGPICGHNRLSAGSMWTATPTAFARNIITRLPLRQSLLDYRYGTSRFKPPHAASSAN